MINMLAGLYTTVIVTGTIGRGEDNPLRKCYCRSSGIGRDDALKECLITTTNRYRYMIVRKVLMDRLNLWK